MAETLIISTLPRELLSDEQLGLCITHALAQRLEIRTVIPANGLLSPAQYAILDDLIIEQTSSLGDLALASRMVRERLHAWNDHPAGISLMERFAAALVKAVRYHRRRDLPPLDPRIRETKNRTVEELNSAFKILRPQFRKARKKPTIREFTEQFREVLKNNDFSHLAANFASWSAFFNAKPETVFESLDRLRAAPASLYDAWLSWATGYEQESLRQKVSSL